MVKGKTVLLEVLLLVTDWRKEKRPHARRKKKRRNNYLEIAKRQSKKWLLEFRKENWSKN